MDDPHAFWPLLGSVTALAIHGVMNIVWIVVALSIVRKASPQGATLLVLASVVQILLSIASPFVSAALGALMSHREGGFDGYVKLLAFWTILAAFFGAGISALTLAGVVRIAHSQRRDTREGAPDVPPHP